MAQKIQVAVVFGGKSTEHEISIISAIQAIHAFEKERYEIIPVYMTKQGLCYVGSEIGEIGSYQKKIEDLLARSVQVDWVREDAHVCLIRHKRKVFGDNLIARIDVVFPIVHGTNVEDGTLTGFFATLGLPVVGCDVLSAAVGMNKYVMKAVLKDNGIPVLPCVCYSWKEYEDEEWVLKDAEERFAYPVIVKPLNLGSSIGISRADNREELREALELAFSYAKKVLVEPAITDLKEVNCAVLGDYEEQTASECESPLGADEILSFQDKYMGGAKGAGKAPLKHADAKEDAGREGAKGSGMASLSRKLPADIPDEQRTQIRELAVFAFRCLGCSGVARFDFLIDRASGQIYLNEVNTVPGSLSFYLWEPVGIPYASLLDKMVEIALKSAREDEKVVYSFDTNVLAHARV